MATSNQENGTESANSPANWEIFGKIVRAYRRSTRRDGYTAAQENMKVKTEMPGKIHPRRLPARAVKIWKIPVLGLTIRVTVCYDSLRSFKR